MKKILVILFIYVMLIILFLFSRPSKWSIAQDKYIKLKEKYEFDRE
ncbi:hypothetical protein [Clostridium sp.]|nr:hypothetical protein [Clostridium sp.]MBK5242809.1 hypothetical protein [Clostridium sp.]